MSEAIDQAEIGEVSEVTPLDSILGGEGSADVTESSTTSGDDSYASQVPLTALKRERERRQKMDARVRELEEEVQRYNDQKWGFDEEQSYDRQANGAEGQGRDVDTDYNKSLTSFTIKHGKERVAAVDAALKRLTPEQQQDVVALVGSARDPVESIHAYIERIGLLNPAFKAMSIQDVLDGKRQPTADDSQTDQRNSELSQREQAVHFAERRAVQAASRGEFIAEHGIETFRQLDAVVDALIQNQHPAVAQLQAVYQSSERPAHAVAELLHQWGALDAPAQHQQPQPSIMPSNFANTRSLSPRRGPAWSGPTALGDIFDRSRANQG